MDLEEKFALAHSSLVTLTLQDLGELDNLDANEQDVVIPQILISDEKRAQINSQNPFFDDFYYLMNSIISSEGIRFVDFKEKINSELPSSLEGYERYLK